MSMFLICFILLQEQTDDLLLSGSSQALAENTTKVGYAVQGQGYLHFIID